MKMDAHQHFWRYDPAVHAWISEDMKRIRRDFLPADLLPELQQAGMDGCIAVQADETIAETDFLLELAQSQPYIKGVVGWADLTHPSLEVQLEAWRGYPKLKGFRAILQGKPDEQYLGNRNFRNGVRSLQAKGYTYDLLVYQDQFPSLIRFIEQLPDQDLILDHLGKPRIATQEIKHWKENLRILAQHPGLYCKLSGMITEANWNSWRYEDILPYLEIAGEYFGADRLCFGSDWPVCLVAGTYESVASVIERFVQQLSPAERAGIWGDNAARFYKLKSTA